MFASEHPIASGHANVHSGSAQWPSNALKPQSSLPSHSSQFGIENGGGRPRRPSLLPIEGPSHTPEIGRAAKLPITAKPNGVRPLPAVPPPQGVASHTQLPPIVTHSAAKPLTLVTHVDAQGGYTKRVALPPTSFNKARILATRQQEPAWRRHRTNAQHRDILSDCALNNMFRVPRHLLRRPDRMYSPWRKSKGGQWTAPQHRQSIRLRLQQNIQQSYLSRQKLTFVLILPRLHPYQSLLFPMLSSVPESPTHPGLRPCPHLFSANPQKPIAHRPARIRQVRPLPATPVSPPLSKPTPLPLILPSSVPVAESLVSPVASHSPPTASIPLKSAVQAPSSPVVARPITPVSPTPTTTLPPPWRELPHTPLDKGKQRAGSQPPSEGHHRNGASRFRYPQPPQSTFSGHPPPPPPPLPSIPSSQPSPRPRMVHGRSRSEQSMASFVARPISERRQSVATIRSAGTDDFTDLEYASSTEGERRSTLLELTTPLHQHPMEVDTDDTSPVGGNVPMSFRSLNALTISADVKVVMDDRDERPLSALVFRSGTDDDMDDVPDDWLMKHNPPASNAPEAPLSPLRYAKRHSVGSVGSFDGLPSPLATMPTKHDDALPALSTSVLSTETSVPGNEVDPDGFIDVGFDESADLVLDDSGYDSDALSDIVFGTNPSPPSSPSLLESPLLPKYDRRQRERERDARSLKRKSQEPPQDTSAVPKRRRSPPRKSAPARFPPVSSVRRSHSVDSRMVETNMENDSRTLLIPHPPISESSDSDELKEYQSALDHGSVTVPSTATSSTFPRTVHIMPFQPLPSVPQTSIGASFSSSHTPVSQQRVFGVGIRPKSSGPPVRRAKSGSTSSPFAPNVRSAPLPIPPLRPPPAGQLQNSSQPGSRHQSPARNVPTLSSHRITSPPPPRHATASPVSRDTTVSPISPHSVRGSSPHIKSRMSSPVPVSSRVSTPPMASSSSPRPPNVVPHGIISQSTTRAASRRTLSIGKHEKSWENLPPVPTRTRGNGGRSGSLSITTTAAVESRGTPPTPSIAAPTPRSAHFALSSSTLGGSIVPIARNPPPSGSTNVAGSSSIGGSASCTAGSGSAESLPRSTVSPPPAKPPRKQDFRIVNR
ncbi:hypothetical protein FISHEDRAFT_74761 [Fistulina hepatica ATCC 64428]|uniref:Uncharacterized protein n=1 Tax=Fistulina hepatica ATCC 64428 TaxID=1128425 RepID=A0A0D7A8K0_9AGAR|nr:hypothetical protein FISHEDRAFT_74761 [Fistulina hepatica ATCC 64428]